MSLLSIEDLHVHFVGEDDRAKTMGKIKVTHTHTDTHAHLYV